jgi:hypothetical protein
VTRREKKKDGPTIYIKRPHQYSFMTHNQLMKIIKRIYNWRSTLYNKKETLGAVSPCQFRYQTRKSPTCNTNNGTSFHLRVNMQMQLEYMEYPQYWNLSHLFNLKCLFSDDPRCYFLYMQFRAWRRTSCVIGIFRFKFNEIDVMTQN